MASSNSATKNVIRHAKGAGVPPERKRNYNQTGHVFQERVKFRKLGSIIL